jgi:hypothetical protein
MCFSAGASFGASVVLSIIGTAAIMKARTIPQGLFAGIPVLFSIQQLAEGMLWLSLNNSGLEPWQPFFIYTFLVFALVVWPIWLPLTIYMLEENTGRKKILWFLLLTGILVSVGASFALLCYPVTVLQFAHHLHYDIDIPGETKDFIRLFSLLYLAPTILVTFISSVNRMRWLGILFSLSYIITLFFYSGSVVSVWCFFAALLSLLVYWIISGLQKQFDYVMLQK